jgi:hypothetical protein
MPEALPRRPPPRAAELEGAGAGTTADDASDRTRRDAVH